MAASTKNIRFMTNNLNSSTTIANGDCSPLSDWENTYDERLATYDRFGYLFNVESDNKKIYINDGSDKTITLTEGVYTGLNLATEVQTQLNASSSNWTVSYSISTRKFTISNTGSVTLRFTQTTDQAWSMLGFTSGAADDTDTSWTGSVVSFWNMYITWDLGAATTVDFFALMMPPGVEFFGSANCTIELLANTTDSWVSPAQTFTLTRTNDGLFIFLDAEASTSYRYWQFRFNDPGNAIVSTAGVDNWVGGMPIAHVYIGQYQELSSAFISQGFSKSFQDRDIIFESHQGARYRVKRDKRRTLSGVSVRGLTDTDRATIEQIYHDQGLYEPFYVCLDPMLEVSTDHSVLTRYVTFANPPLITNVVLDRYDAAMDFIEAL
jgi:hypothetical protein